MRCRRIILGSEHQHQCALIEWADAKACSHPELELLFAIPNGGNRDSWVGARLKREGVRRGVPDLCLPVARLGAHGLFIEMKVRRKKPTPEQESWHERLKAGGYIVSVCYSVDEARDIIEGYLGLGRT